ncbi:MAG: bifunctional demethylmenaquinone methyltransferase/2-methoxy-6-polyprenyl-1,4-benzoquinol methylase UbiE [Burkholderiales bacterium]
MSVPDPEKSTHFGFETVAESEKAQRVAEVFSSVADRYDLMNDVMSGGLHRLWKHFTVAQSGVKTGSRVLDVAAGSGDMALRFAKRVGSRGQVWLTDINPAMLSHGRDRLVDHGFLCPAVRCDGERLPFPDDYFDCVVVAFGLRNMTRKEAALREMYRVLRPGGNVLVLEFSRIYEPLRPIYDAYSFKVIPALGELIAGDADSYRYLAESIRVHPDQRQLKRMMEQAGLERVDFFSLAAGVVALHRGFKF